MTITATNPNTFEPITINVTDPANIRVYVDGELFTGSGIEYGYYFENRLARLIDDFFDGDNYFANGIEYSADRGCDGHKVRIERDAELVEA